MSRKRTSKPDVPPKSDRIAVLADGATKPGMFPIVGIGASAGGLEAFTHLLKALPSDTGMGFVLVQHLDPQHESALTQILSRATSLPVTEIKDKEPVQRDRVYVIPRDRSLIIEGGMLKLGPRGKIRAPHRPIDAFFESLAADQRDRAIGVVLSGTASDGTLGLEAIKAEGGITFAQDDSAKHDSMPRSAIAAGCVDLVLSPADIARELARIAKHPYSAAAADEQERGGVGLKDDRGGDPRGEAERAEATAHSDDGAALPSGGPPSAAPDKKTPRQPGKRARSQGDRGQRADDDGYKKILLHLRNHSGVDFSLYKSTTIRRRINRRMILTRHETLDGYAAFLKGDGKELDALYSDVLISVTSFFRNPEMFDALQRTVFLELLKRGGKPEGSKTGDDPLRCWVLGCSTGQEAYSIAMAFVETAESSSRSRKLQIFATDLNDALLDKARHGLYAKSLADEISPERLRRFFTEESGGYRISKALREMVVFARQNLIADPPFSRMDLISCRNLLIYLEPALQKRALPTFHYALRPGGFLLLGASESIGAFTDLFEPVDKKQKIFVRKGTATSTFHLPLSRAQGDDPPAPARQEPLKTARSADTLPTDALRGELDAQREADRLTVNQFAPPSVLINAEMQVLQFRGATAPYLQPPAGKASFNVLKMAREGLMLPLRAAINQAIKENKTARRRNVRVKTGGRGSQTRAVNLEVIPLRNLRERCFLVLFEETGKGAAARLRVESGGASKVPPLSEKQETSRAAELETELSETREYLQSTQEQHEAAIEELQSANEEVQSANEELQSVNEELETSKEELESTNEELHTVNDEMNNRNVELNRLNNDIVNLQASTKLPVILLGRDLTIRRFSPAAAKQFDLLSTDVGRPIGHIRHGLVCEDHQPSVKSPANLESIAAEVIGGVHEQECDAQGKGGGWYSLRIRPYLTLDNKVDGAVLVLLDITDRKRAADASARLASIVTGSEDAIVSKDLDGVITSWNKGAQHLFGYTAEEAIGKPVTILIPPDHLNEEPDILARIRRGEAIEHYATVRRRKDGTLLNVSLTVSPLKDGTGRVIGASKIARDITDRVRAEAALRHSEDFSRTVLESSPDCVKVLDAGGRLLRMNANGICLMEIDDIADFAGKEWIAIWPADSRGRVAAAIEAATRGETDRFRAFCPTAKGTPKWWDVIVSPVRDGQGNVLRLVAVSRDDTEAMHAEENLRHSESRYRRLFETAHDGILVLDATTAIVIDVNRFMLDLLRFPREHFIGKELWQLGVFQDKHQSVEAMRRLQREGSIRYENLPLQDRDGRRIPVEFISNLYQEDQHPVIQCNIRDVSERKRFEDEREAHLHNEQMLRMEAENANRAKDMFLATLSHEMRTPLNAIVGWMTILRAKGCGEEDLAEGLDVIERNTNAQVHLIEDVLDVSRIVSGKLRLEMKPCELTETIRAGVEAVRPAAEARGIRLELDLDPAASKATCDATRIQQVIWNLVSNAVKFTPMGGTVRVALGRDGSALQIQVSDSGQGIGPELLPYVFDRFRQADSSSRRRFGGLGLGLSIVKHLVEAHGGTVEAHSAGEGKGATFTVRLPIRAVRLDEDGEVTPPRPRIGAFTNEHPTPREPLPLVRLDELRVLVVDDEADARRLLVKVLEGVGAIVTAAGSAAEAMAMLSGAKPQVLVSDLGMPEQDGFDLIRQVRSAGHPAKELPAVALTAFVHKEVQRQTLLAGFQVHVPKPVDPGDLIATVASLAGRTG